MEFSIGDRVQVIKKFIDKPELIHQEGEIVEIGGKSFKDKTNVYVVRLDNPRQVLGFHESTIKKIKEQIND